jgi:hypothetical protein
MRSTEVQVYSVFRTMQENKLECRRCWLNFWLEGLFNKPLLLLRPCLSDMSVINSHVHVPTYTVFHQKTLRGREQKRRDLNLEP